MKISMTVDDTKLKLALKGIVLKKQDLLDIEGAGAYVVVDGERMRVPVDTAATKNSIKPHILEADDNHVVDEVGPETLYAPYLEYGTYKMKAQPFVRPTVAEDADKVQAAVSAALGAIVEERWPK
jgi:HK97 gp10 family phage protein